MKITEYFWCILKASINLVIEIIFCSISNTAKCRISSKSTEISVVVVIFDRRIVQFHSN